MSVCMVFFSWQINELKLKQRKAVLHDNETFSWKSRLLVFQGFLNLANNQYTYPQIFRYQK